MIFDCNPIGATMSSTFSALQVVFITALVTVLEFSANTKGQTTEGLFRRQVNCVGEVVSRNQCPVQVQTTTVGKCAAWCLQRDGCLGFVRDSSQGECHLCVATARPDCTNTQPASPGEKAYELIACMTNGGTSSFSGTCKCPSGFGGNGCQIQMKDCDGWQEAGYPNGVYWVRPSLNTEAFRVRCSMEWNRTVIMSRTSNTLDFNRSWVDYRDGFGDVEGDHWLGLENIRLLSQPQPYPCLVIQFTLSNFSFYIARYLGFGLSDETGNYALDFHESKCLSPPMGDCLGSVKGKPFSTYDADHDDDGGGSCAALHQSGWWFGGCTMCNPTGVMTQPADMQASGNPEEVFWKPGLDGLSPQKVEMFLKDCQ
ncbi:microfibril-associated glycoprotein 4-like isoform X2 [Littorina saxatilis]|uniref:microfibril-associated glycoprotein 4-like isoform X2 n=1 Tax=Littorina saxatilis TaxID=31220 RepID=UPI0038B5A939